MFVMRLLEMFQNLALINWLIDDLANIVTPDLQDLADKMSCKISYIKLDNHSVKY